MKEIHEVSVEDLSVCKISTPTLIIQSTQYLWFAKW